jgi:hypothetical protein
LMHNMVSPRMRATATALMFLVLNLVGLGLGPTLTGMASDFYASRHFTALLAGAGHFASACPGGRAPPGAMTALKAACHGASAFGVRWAIVTCAGAYLWAAVHYFLAARHVRQDLATPGTNP